MIRNKIVVFGAGATGRGHVGLLAWQAGFEMVFADIQPELVLKLRSAGEYTVNLYGRQMQTIRVTNFRIYDASQRMEIAREITDAALVLTAVFDPNLLDVAQTLALAVKLCRQAGRTEPLNCIACENMMDSSSALGRHTRTCLEADDVDYFKRTFGFPDCMISRVVPRPEPDPLTIVAEDYNEWTARADAFKGEKPPSLAALELVDNQTARLERKLFIHNGGHAVCGYFGYHRGHRYIHEAVADGFVAEHVLGALDELGEVVRRKHGFSRESIEEYKQDLCRRGAVPEIKDEILRVVRDPIRKLSSRERLVAPALLAEQYGLPRGWIVKGIAAVLRCVNPADSQAGVLQDKLKNQGVIKVLEEICDIPGGSSLSKDIQQAYNQWKL